MSGVFHALAAVLVVGHLAFVAFATLGALLALRWPRMIWGQLPAVVWAIYIELTGGICPLTPLENRLRGMAGLDEYGGDFVARYLFPILYPEGLTRAAQTIIAVLLLLMNTGLYAFVYMRARSSRK